MGHKAPLEPLRFYFCNLTSYFCNFFYGVACAASMA
jgi:hypothetical protein